MTGRRDRRSDIKEWETGVTDRSDRQDWQAEVTGRSDRRSDRKEWQTGVTCRSDMPE